METSTTVLEQLHKPWQIFPYQRNGNERHQAIAPIFHSKLYQMGPIFERIFHLLMYVSKSKDRQN